MAADAMAALNSDFGKWYKVVHFQKRRVIKFIMAVDTARAAELEDALKKIQELEDETNIKAKYIKELEELVSRSRAGNLDDEANELLNETLEKLGDCQSELNDAKDALCGAEEQLLEANHEINELKHETKRLRKDRNVAIKAYVSEYNLRCQHAQPASASAASASCSSGFKRSNEYLGDDYLPITWRISFFA